MASKRDLTRLPLPHSLSRPMFISLLGLVCVTGTICLASFSSRSLPGNSISLHVANDVGVQPPFVLQQSWAQYSPFFSLERYRAPPQGCNVVQVNILQRHGARYPTSGAAARILQTLAKFQQVTTYTKLEMAFLQNFTYELGTDDLIPFGAAQSFQAGSVALGRYQHLVSEDRLPFVRASGSERVVLSATNWTAGFSAASKRVYNPVLSVILDEALNDTLDDAMCPNAGDSTVQTNQWLSIYGSPLAARLNDGAAGANLTASDVYNLISMCPFHTLFELKRSPFCDIFTQEDFEAFEYSGDLDKYYGTGYGQQLGRVQGVGYVNELLARLTNSPVQDNTQTNRTLDASPETFPFDRTMYVDFSHDNQMIAIYAALGLFPQSAPLDPSLPASKRDWLASHMVPFSAQMVTEKLSCNSMRRSGEYVRILVSDAVQPLEFCDATEGLCSLEAFVESQSYARNNGEGDFEKCSA